MKAMVYTQYGASDVLRLKEVEKPIPESNELLIKVHASTVSAGVIWMRKGQFPGSKLFTFLIRLRFGIMKPKHPILGFEFSGIVEDIGKRLFYFKKVMKFMELLWV